MSVESAKDQISRFKEQLVRFELDDDIKEYLKKIDANVLKGIAIVGMGGSALSGELLKNYLEHLGFDKPIFIFRRYELPDFIDKNYFLFIQSYSGNTEETLSCLKDAFRKQVKGVVISSGGIAKDFAKKYEFPFIEMPKGFQPRLALGFFLMRELAIIEYLFNLDFEEDFRRIDSIKWEKFQKMAETLADKIEATPLIYATYPISSIAKIWKALINECAKMHCFANEFSELNHNEMVGFTLDKDYYVIMIEDESDHYRLRKRVELLQGIFKKNQVKSIVLALKGGSFLTRLLSLVYLGMWLSFYLALRNEVDPERVDIIENFKKKLGRFI